MSVGIPSHRDGLFRLVADILPLLVWISGSDKRCTYFNKPWLDFTGDPSSPRSAMVGQPEYTPQICSIAWTRTPAPSTVVNRS
jgi:PAS domain-containing protein